MPFDPKSLWKSSAWPMAGAFLVALGLLELLKAFSYHLIQPLFHVINGRTVHPGQIELGTSVHLNCAAFFGGLLVFVAAVALGLLLLRLGSRD